jgi:hypothetical protein
MQWQNPSFNRCALHVYRLAVYFAENEMRDLEKTEMAELEEIEFAMRG